MPSMASAVLAVALNLILLVSIHEGTKFKELQIFDGYFKECMKNPPEELAEEDRMKIVGFFAGNIKKDGTVNEFEIVMKQELENVKSIENMLIQELKCVNSIYGHHERDAENTKLMLYMYFLTLHCTVRVERYTDVYNKEKQEKPYSADREKLKRDFEFLHATLYAFVNSIPHESILKDATQMYKEMLEKTPADELTKKQIQDIDYDNRENIRIVELSFENLREPDFNARYKFNRRWENAQKFVKSLLPAETKLPHSWPDEDIATKDYEEMMKRVRKTGFPNFDLQSNEPGSSIVNIIRAILNDSNDQGGVGTSHDRDALESNRKKLKKLEITE